MTTEKRVHVIDDDEAVRSSIEFLLSTTGHNVITYASAEEFLSRAPATADGCLITDVRMPGMSGIDLTRQLRALGLGALPVIVVTGHGDVPLAVEAMKAGAVDFIEKPFDEERLLAALDACSRAVAAGSARQAESAGVAQRLATLSGRERDVLKGLVAGQPNKVIASDLGISPRTVEIYRANVMTKMKAGSLSELVRQVILLDG
jgi:two-component system response regulator FixJ